ncbi:DUF1638 domain-containing protein [Zhaonella formicivorans]|uniref:DUF1638 domain-containing protein n=1 Tax=Zhaonella formicivorans TaxID=2528593 RepID=UPI0010E76C57|nr:DUF1638 domain-containing protein [Zhaonella formicivorans]
MKCKIFACKTMEDEVLAVKPPELECEFLEYALHRVPTKLTRELQQRIDAAQEFDTLLFGYGLCSNGTAHLRSPKHTLVVPKTHDCISLLLGSRAAYDREFEQFPATIYLSKGWIDQEAEPLAEFRRYAKDYGEELAQSFIDQMYSNYQRVVFIYTELEGLDRYRDYAREVAAYLGVNFAEREGSLRLLRKLVRGEWDQEFVVNPPGQIIMQRSFL